MAILGADGRYVGVDDALCAMLGRSRSQLIGERDNEITQPDDRARDVDLAWKILRGRLDSVQLEKRFRRARRRERLGDREHDVPARRHRHRDRLGRRLPGRHRAPRAGGRAGRQATHETLTGLLNHRGFHERPRREIARCRRQGVPISLVISTSTTSSASNDTYRHPMGDRVLAEVGRRFRTLTREGEHIARVGGEEFAWILPATHGTAPMPQPSAPALPSSASSSTASAG